MIELTAPWALASLVGVPIIVILHLMRPRRRTLRLASTVLWRAALAEHQHGIGLRKLLRDLSLVALLLAALALSLALADPHWLVRASEGQDTVVVLDVSASMQTAGSRSGTRFDEVRAQALVLVDRLPRDGSMLVMTSGRVPKLHSGFERGKDTLRDVIARIAPTDEAGRPHEALALALSLLKNRETGRVVFLTDGAFDDKVDLGSDLIEYRNVVDTGNTGGRNVAITRFDVRRELRSEDRFQVLLSVRNYTPERLSVPISVSLGRRQLLERNLALPSNGTRTVVLPFRGKATGGARARVDINDDLAADDEAFAVTGVDVPMRVALVSPGNFYLEHVLQALPNVEYTTHKEVDAEALRYLTRRHDVVVLDRVNAPALPTGRFVLLDSIPPGLPFSAVGTVANPRVEGRGTSTLLRGVDLGGVRIDTATRIEIAAGTEGVQRLFWSPETVLALALVDESVRVVYLGFDLERSSLPNTVAFPVLVSQSLAWLRPNAQASPSTQLSAGKPYPVDLPAGGGEVVMRLPDGEGRFYQAEGPRFLFDDTSRAGIYSYTVDGIEQQFAVNLTDEHESDIRPRAKLPELRAPVTARGAGSQVTVPLWPYLVAFAALLLALENVLWGVRHVRA